MKIRAIALSVALATASLAAQANPNPPIPTFEGQAAAKAAAPGTTPQTPEQWLMRMTDFTQNASAYRDPRLFNPWLNAVTEPGFMIAGMQGAMDPAGWLNMMNSMANPNAVRNWMGFTNPDVYAKWMQASMDPAFYAAMLATLSDPAKMMRWAMLPLDPRLWNLMLQMFNPNLYIKWGIAGMDPRAWQLVGNVMNPALYTSYLGAMVTPYGANPQPAQQQPGNLGNWFTWTPPNSGMHTTNPWGSTTAGATGFNFFDPVAWFGYLGSMIPNLSLPTLPGTTQSGTTQSGATQSGATQSGTTQSGAAQPAAPAQPAPPAPAPAAPEKITLSGDALFPLGKSGIRDISHEGKARLDQLVNQIKAMGEIEQIRVVGHADASGRADANQKLSETRANTVKSYLVAKGIKPGIIITSGAGSSQPVVQCDMKQPSKQLAACLAPNRRVEIEIVAKAK